MTLGHEILKGSLNTKVTFEGIKNLFLASNGELDHSVQSEPVSLISEGY